LYEFDACCADLMESGEQCDGGSEATHGNFIAAASVQKAGGIESKDFFDGQRVFATGGGFVFIMIEVGGGEEEDVVVRGKDFGERLPYGGEDVEVERAQGDGHKCESRV